MKYSEEGIQSYILQLRSVTVDDIHIFPPALEQKTGHVLKPYILTLRATMPIYGMDKRLHGIVIISLDLGKALAL